VVNTWKDSTMTETSSAAATLALRGEHITLAQALKAVGLAGTGGAAKVLVRTGDVLVNGTAVTQPGRKLHAGDRFGLVGGPEWTITG
jgi:ribosome-associated protein